MGLAERAPYGLALRLLLLRAMSNQTDRNATAATTPEPEPDSMLEMLENVREWSPEPEPIREPQRGRSIPGVL